MDGDGGYTLVQTDADIGLESDPICNSAGCTQYKHKKKDRGYDINYFVPNFGRDHEINANHDSLEWAEKQNNHKMAFPDGRYKKKDPVLYVDGGPLEKDIRDSLDNLNEQEA